MTTAASTQAILTDTANAPARALSALPSTAATNQPPTPLPPGWSTKANGETTNPTEWVLPEDTAEALKAFA